MALRHIVAAIEQEADEAVAQSEADAQARAATIAAESETATERALSSRRAACETERAHRRAALEATLALEARRLVDGTRARAIEQALELLRARLSALRDDTARYRPLFSCLVREARDALPEAAYAEVDPRDASAARAELGPAIAVKPQRQGWGGVVLDDGRGRRVDNTLEARAERAEPELCMAAARLYGWTR